MSRNWKQFFVPEDFIMAGDFTKDDLVNRANALLLEALEASPKVTGGFDCGTERFPTYAGFWSEAWGDGGGKPMMSARLVDLEEIR